MAMHDELPQGRGCVTTLELADRYVSGELPRDMSDAIEEHLAGCASCARAIDDRRRLRNRLRHAVNAEAAPAALRDAIATAVRRPRRGATILRLLGGGPVLYYAAAALVVVAIGTWGILRMLEPNGERPPQLAGGDSVAHGSPAGPTNEPTAESAIPVLRVGLMDHVVCALTYKHGAQRMTAEEMTAAMGPRYAGLVRLVHQHAGDYEVVVAHQCTIQNRAFVHMILRKGDRIVSLAITDRGNDSFTGAGSRSVRQIQLFQARIQDARAFNVTGFQTRDHLAFLVADADNAAGEQLANNLAPGIHDYLNQLST